MSVLFIKYTFPYYVISECNQCTVILFSSNSLNIPLLMYMYLARGERLLCMNYSINIYDRDLSLTLDCE